MANDKPVEFTLETVVDAIDDVGGEVASLRGLLEEISEGIKALNARPVAAAQSPFGRQAAPGGGPVFPNFGQKKGEPIFGAAEKELRYYGGAVLKSIADPSKSRYLDNNRQMLAHINAELSRQGKEPMDEPGSAVQTQRAPGGGYGGGEMLDNTPGVAKPYDGAPSDDDVPFAVREYRLDRP